MKPLPRILTMVVLCAICYRARADVLELKNGQVLTGKYSGGTTGTIRFETASGLQVIETSQALALTFTAPAPVAATPTPTPAPAPAAAAQSDSVTIPAGTTLLVRMVDGASSRDPVGKRFATTLETDLLVEGKVAIRAGTKVYGRVNNAKQAGRVAGRSILDLRLTEFTVGGALMPIVSSPYAEVGKGSLGKTAKGAAAGAAIGGIAGDAGKGAAIGATASTLKKGQTLVVARGELLEFRLQQPITVKVAQP